MGEIPKRRGVSSALSCVLLLTLAGCGEDSTAPAEVVDNGEPRVTEPSPYIYDGEARSIEPALAGDALGGAIEEAIATVMSLDIAPLQSTYDAALAAAGGAGCPVMVENYVDGTDAVYWQGDCQTEAGATFRGFGAYGQYENSPFADGTIDGWYLNHSGTISVPGGATIEGSGSANRGEGANAAAALFLQTIDGTFALTGGGVVTTWFDGSRSPSLTLFAAKASAVDARIVSLEGGISGLEGAITTVSFSEVELGERFIGWPCPEEPHGAISVRGDDGEWYDVVFHGVKFEEQGEAFDESLCDGCGDVWFRGEMTGQACLDFRGLFDWTDRPW